MEKSNLTLNRNELLEIIVCLEIRVEDIREKLEKTTNPGTIEIMNNMIIKKQNIIDHLNNSLI